MKSNIIHNIHNLQKQVRGVQCYPKPDEEPSTVTSTVSGQPSNAFRFGKINMQRSAMSHEAPTRTKWHEALRKRSARLSALNGRLRGINMLTL